MCLSGSTCHIAEAWIVVVTHSMHDRRFHGPYPAQSAACNAADCLRRQGSIPKRSGRLMCWSRLGECARAIQCKRHNSRVETVENREDMESVTYWGHAARTDGCHGLHAEDRYQGQEAQCGASASDLPVPAGEDPPRNRWSLRRADSGVQTAGDFGKRS